MFDINIKCSYILGNLTPPFLSVLKSITDEFKDINLVESPHLSLSKTFILKHHWIGSFVKTLNDEINSKSNKDDGIFITFDNSRVLFLSNEDKTRHFACLPVDESIHHSLKDLIRKVDKCLNEFNLPTYYADPKFHISILWKLQEFTGDEKTAISNCLNSIDNNLEYLIYEISLKTGNKFYSIAI